MTLHQVIGVFDRFAIGAILSAVAWVLLMMKLASRRREDEQAAALLIMVLCPVVAIVGGLAWAWIWSNTK